jgi:hypothetical protein
VARWEAGETEPQAWQRPRIAEALGISLCEFNQLLNEVETTECAVEVSASLVGADGALLAEYEQVQEAWSREAALVGAGALTGGFRQENSSSFPHESLPLPPPDVTVTSSQDVWRAVRRYLSRYGIDLAKQAVRLYDPTWQVPHTPTLALPSWLPSAPVPIESVTLEWIPQPPRPILTGQEAELRPVLPLRVPRHAFRQYTSAIRYLNPPSLFENRPSYRLLDVSWDSSRRGTLQFGLATFFDKLDVSEALSHEFAAAMMEGVAPVLPQLPFRALLSQPFDLSIRMATASIDTLTIRRDTTDGSCTFLLLGRNPAKVVVGGGEYGVVPAGEFQPASISPASLLTDLDLWRNVVREYSEELLGNPEHDGSGGRPLDYECWPFYHAMQRARESGQLRGYVLGIVLHALSLNPSIVTAVVIDDVVFDDLFRDLVVVNAEGRIVTSLDNNQSVHGLPFTEETVHQFLEREPLGGTSAACLALAWQYRDSLVQH